MPLSQSSIAPDPCGEDTRELLGCWINLDRRAMPIRLRKLIGAVLLVILVPAWALVAMTLAQSPLVKSHGLVEVAYYVIAGLGWVVPAMPLVRWMSRNS